MVLPAKPFYMIRHGETVANRDHIMAGSLDSPLTNKGRMQAETVRDSITSLEVKPGVIVHSNLSRARDTAGIINEALDVPMHENPDLAELFAGQWEGLPYSEWMESFMNFSQTPPGGEKFDDFFKRVARGVKDTLGKYDTPLIVAHGGVLRAVGAIYGLLVPAIFKNCHLYEFQPALEISPFPWEVYSYDIDDNNTLKRTRDNIYDNSGDF